MVGLVIVSHSATLAEGTRDLANTMTQGRVPIAVAGGIDDPDNPFGTDAMKVASAIEAVYSPDGVIVLMDLGSAVLSAETALEFIAPEHQAQVYLCDAPLVEGTIAAAVQAGAGSPIVQVLSEAREALAAKAAQLAPLIRDAESGKQKAEKAPSHLSPSDKNEGLSSPSKEGAGGWVAIASSESEQPLALIVTVPNALGLHARPAARLVSLIGNYSAHVTIRKGERTVNGASINQVVTLGARQGDALEFSAQGQDGAAVLEAIAALAADNFGDVEAENGKRVEAEQGTEPPTELTPLSHSPLGGEVMVGISAAPGIAIAPAFRLDGGTPTFSTYTITDIAGEMARVNRAIEATLADIAITIAETEKKVGKEEAGIFVAHQLMLQDPELLGNVAHELNENPRNAEAIWWAVIEAFASAFQQLDDPYLQARAADILDIGRQVLRHLVGIAASRPTLTTPAIIVAEEISPSQMAGFDVNLVRGIVTAAGGATSHSAILARSLGIPAVVGVGDRLEAISSGQAIAIDGGKGWLYPAPNEAQIATLEAEQSAWRWAQSLYAKQSQQPAITTDGRRIEVAANLASPTDAAKAFQSGAEGVGLFRTEFLFMERGEAPTEEEQFDAYTKAAEGLAGHPVIIRTLDVGGDKPIPYLTSSKEENPFLGHRGIRNWLAAPALARTQLRAICRASHNHALKIMFPMVSTVAEVDRAKTLLAEVQAELSAEGMGYNPALEVGIMIEVPAAVWNAPALAQEVSFFSIGTNDLTQYIMAADRGNPNVSELADYFQPAVLRAIQQVVAAAEAAEIWVGMCGEMAGNPVALPLLVGLGLSELSMSAGAIPEIKAKIRGLAYEHAQTIARHTLTLPSAEAVRAYLSTL